MSDRNATVDFFFLSSTLLYPWVLELNLEMEQFLADKLMINSNIVFRFLFLKEENRVRRMPLN